MTDETETPSTGPATILDRLLAAGISDERAREHLAHGSVQVEGEPVTSIDTPAPWPTRYVINPR